ncbi:DNA-binding response OmpR family regulator [Plasticicumulans acidivorans]|uniref:DNA-binding response OmpR family regulator n=2 Tax=Plasticicumulans acidivorans TaxID=886464 RepID=A0A317MZI8_9GAMM|nr:DNA-binding response OmpR family regulator [Plasticicumulans acidivorans]
MLTGCNGTMTSARVLLVEDDERLAELIGEALVRAGYAVESTGRLQDARRMLRRQAPELLLLDLGLPDGDGLETLAQLRAQGESLPVMVMTARDGLDDRVRGLDAGADDYLVKPFAVDELLARCRALLRRPQALGSARLSCSGVSVDSRTRDAAINGQPLALTRRETDLLAALLRHPGTTQARMVLEDAVYSCDDEVGPNALEALVSRLRRKLDGGGARVAIVTVRGLGYQLRALH